MEKLGDKFIKALSEELPKFFNFFLESWKIDRMVNHKDEKFDNEDFFYWDLLQNIAKKKIESFANQFPEEVKKQYKQEFDETKNNINKFEQQVKDLFKGVNHAL